MKKADFSKEALFDESKPSIRLILETDHTKEIRILMKNGQEMQQHQTPFPIVVHLISGNIDFTVDNKTHNLSSGSILSLEGDIPHSLMAKEDSVVRLSLSKGDSVDRVESVVAK